MSDRENAPTDATLPQVALFSKWAELLNVGFRRDASANGADVTVTSMIDRPVGAEASAPRDTRMDNAKFVLVVLVILGHLIGDISMGDKSLLAAWTFIHIFHMPFFIFISGYFTHGDLSGKKIYQLFVKLLVPYAIFQVLFIFLKFWVLEQRHLDAEMLRPAYVLWYFPALFLYRLLVPILMRLRFPLLAALAIGLLIGFSDYPRRSFGVTKALAFLPFFVLGMQVAQWKIRDFLFKREIKVAAVIVCLAAYAIVYFYFTKGYGQWLLMRPYSETAEVVHWTTMFTRFFVYGAALAISASLLALIPSRESFVSRAGKRTLYIFVLHLFVTMPLVWVGKAWIDFGQISEFGWWMILTAVSLGLAFLLASDPIVKLFKPLLEPSEKAVRVYALPVLVGGYILLTIAGAKLVPHYHLVPIDWSAVERASESPDTLPDELIESVVRRDTIRLMLQEPRSVPSFYIGLSANDDYNLVFFLKNKSVGKTSVRRLASRERKVVERRVLVPVSAQENGFDRIDMRAIKGDRTYGFAYLRLKKP
jgi:fucose 4-O-acetylase-like acetyltransferase